MQDEEEDTSVAPLEQLLARSGQAGKSRNVLDLDATTISAIPQNEEDALFSSAADNLKKFKSALSKESQLDDID